MNAASADLILLKGAPGVGKSTVGRLLAQHFSSGVRIEVDTLRQMVISVDWTNQAEHRKVLKLSVQLAAGFLSSGFCPVILIDTFSGDKIDGFLTDFHSLCPSKRVCVVVLHASEDVLRERLLHREAGAFRDVAIAMRINEQAISNVHPRGHLVDTTNLTQEKVLESIMRLASRVESSLPSSGDVGDSGANSAAPPNSFR